MDDEWVNDFYKNGNVFQRPGRQFPGCIPCAHFLHKLWLTMKLINSETPRTPVIASFIFMVSLYYYAMYDNSNIVIRKFKELRKKIKRNALGVLLRLLLSVTEVIYVIIFPLFSYYTTWIPGNKAAYYVADHTNSEFWLKTVALMISLSTFIITRRSVLSQQTRARKFYEDQPASSRRHHRPRGTWYNKYR